MMMIADLFDFSSSKPILAAKVAWEGGKVDDCESNLQ